jgi:protein-S-isoprenylcysteine O-methyltransferase Ste14
MSGRIFALHAVGTPGLFALVLGGLGFFATLAATRLGARSSGPGGKSSGVSAAGILLQMLGFFSVGFGPVSATLPAAGLPAVAEGAAVALLMAGSVLLFGSAARTMGANWSLIARTRADHQLVTSGVFARLRHPIYTAMALFLIALAVALGHEAHLAAGAPLFAVGTWIRVREEEKLLRAQFGDAYDLYAERVKRFVPGLL